METQLSEIQIAKIGDAVRKMYAVNYGKIIEWSDATCVNFLMPSLLKLQQKEGEENKNGKHN